MGNLLAVFKLARITPCQETLIFYDNLNTKWSLSGALKINTIRAVHSEVSLRCSLSYWPVSIAPVDPSGSPSHLNRYLACLTKDLGCGHSENTSALVTLEVSAVFDTADHSILLKQVFVRKIISWLQHKLYGQSPMSICNRLSCSLHAQRSVQASAWATLPFR